MNGKWNNEFGEVNLIKEIKLRRWLKASFYDKLETLRSEGFHLFVELEFR